jgi:MFS family permease
VAAHHADVDLRPPLDPNQRLLAIALVLGVTLVAFESTAVITALPTIADELGGDSLYGVALAAYTLADMVALVAAGLLADRVGPRTPFLLSIATFVAGLIVAGTATSMVVIVLGRTLQGAATGGMAPLSYVLVNRAFPKERQAAMYVWLSAGWVLPSLVAPAFAGLVTDHIGWKWVFLTIIPFALAVGAIANRPMRAFGPATDGVAEPRRLLYAFGAAGGVAALVVGLRADHVIVAAVVSLAGTMVAVPMIRRLLPPGFFSARSGLSAVLACRVLATATFLGVDSFIPLAADRIHGATAVVQGFVIVGAALAWTGGQAIMSRRTDIPPRNPVRLGFLLLMVGTLLVVPVLWSGWPLWVTFLSWPVGGLGMGVLFNPTTLAAMSFAPDGNEGTVSGQTHFADSLGFSLMGGIGGATVAIADRTSLGLRTAIGINFGLAVACAALGLLASRGVRRSR